MGASQQHTHKNAHIRTRTHIFPSHYLVSFPNSFHLSLLNQIQHFFEGEGNRRSVDVVTAKGKKITDEMGHITNEMTTQSHFILPLPPFLPLLTSEPLSLTPCQLILS